MKNFAQLGRQLLGIWQQLGINQRISIILASAIVIGGLVTIALWSGRTPYGLLYGKLDDAEAAKVIGVLDELKIGHKIGQGGAAIYVPQDKVHLARMQLASRGIPRGDGVGFEIFDKPNFGLSDFVQRANYLRAVQGELARTISQLDEIEAARVMVVAPENRLLVDGTKRSTASVFVKTKGSAILSPSAVSAIRFLVANAIEGLQAGHVTVVDNRGNVLSENSDTDSIAGLTASQLSARRSLEQYLAKKAEGMLEAVLGPGQAVVRVSAEINLDTLNRVEEKFDPDGQVVRTSTINDESTDTTTASAGGGAPGVDGNLGDDTNSVAGPVNNSRVKKKVTNNQYEINKTVNNMTQLAGGVKRLSAAVFVAARYQGAGAERRIAPRPTDELEKLRRIVQSALGIQMGDPTQKGEIALEEMPFNPDSIGTSLNSPPSTLHMVLEQAQKFIYLPIIAIVFVIFWRLLKRTPVETLSSANVNPAGKSNINPGNGHQSTSMDALNRLARENPNNLTEAIQTWLGRKT